VSYLSNSTRLSSLTIGGIDYTSSMVSWIASDSTAFKNGCIETSGTVVLGRRIDSGSIEDYDRNLFKRGVPVILEVTYPDGSTERHPRGLLYVISNSYNVESDQITIELGCRLVLANITDELDDLIELSPLQLDPTQREYSNISAAFASTGQVIYQDNQGDYQTRQFFEGDDYSGIAAGEWLSIAGVTALSVSPLQGSGAIPDTISLQYQVPTSTVATDNTGYVDTVVDVSNYWAAFPGITYERRLPVLPSSVADKASEITSSSVSVAARPTSSSSACGNTLPPPNDSFPSISCIDTYEAVKVTQYYAATQTQTTTTYYDAVGGQVSRIFSEVYGPAIEANQQYYADKYAFCRSLYAVYCDVNGSCPMEGLETIRLGYETTENEYGEANELIRTVRDTYVTTLSAAKTDDWRSGIVSGNPQDFNIDLSATDMYRTSRVITEFYREDNANVQLTTTYTSAVSRGVGIQAGIDAIDALNGIKTTQKRISTTTATLDIAPDRVNTSTTETTELSSQIVLFIGRYQENPPEAGPYEVDESVPMPLLYDDAEQVEAVVNDYENYITRFYKGDVLGMQIGEALRLDIASNWFVGRPFRYYDVVNSELIAMRMDACAWGVDQSGASVVTNGIWIGVSDGSVTIPQNLVGNSGPDLGPGTPTPTPPPSTVPPSVDEETTVDSGAFAFVVNVYFGTSSTMTPAGDGDGAVTITPSDLTYIVNEGFVSMVAGLVVEPGSLLSTDGNGDIPIVYDGNLLAEDAVVVNGDLFATA
jgi:hypothetical protein